MKKTFNKNDKNEKNKYLCSDFRKIIIISFVLLIWIIGYSILIFNQNSNQPFRLIIITVSNLLKNVSFVIIFGFSFVMFFALANLYFNLTADPFLIVKIEEIFNDFRKERDFSKLYSQLADSVILESNQSPMGMYSRRPRIHFTNPEHQFNCWGSDLCTNKP